MLSRNQQYRRTKGGVVSIIFGAQKQHSITRGHNPPCYTRKELKEWLYSQDIFHELYNRWADSGFNHYDKPSCDRIDNNIGYSFENITITTWGENSKRANKDTRDGVLIHGVNPQKKVMKISISDGECIEVYNSSCEAARQNGLLQSKISMVCNGKRKKHGGFSWKYISDT